MPESRILKLLLVCVLCVVGVAAGVLLVRALI
jgi:uncharacterized membrane protein